MASSDSAAAASFAEAAQKTDEELAALEKEEQALAAVEADLMAAESRVEAAEIRYGLVCRQVAREMAKPLAEVPSVSAPTMSKEPEVDEEKALKAEEGVPQKESVGSKNAGAMSEKELSSERWKAKRASEGRVRDATKRARERLRRGARDKRSQFAEEPCLAAAEDAAEPAAAGEKAATPEVSTTGGTFSGDPATVEEGAKGIAERVRSLKERPNAAEKQAALANVIIGGRENYFTYEPAEVLLDLEKRGLVDADLAKEMTSLILETPAAKGSPMPPGEWLAHAKKMSSIERADDKPFTESEVSYLKTLDTKNFATAEAELEKAEAQLQELVRQMEARFPDACAEEAVSSPARKISADGPEVDQDYAERLESQHEKDVDSKGAKNTSARSEKENSKEKWEAERGSEQREKEKQVKARDARRTEARDRKMGDGDVDE